MKSPVKTPAAGALVNARISDFLLSSADTIAEAERRRSRRAQGLPLHDTPAEAAARIHEDDDRLEREIQADVVKLYKALGCQVWSHSELRKTKQTPGYPDLTVLHPRRRLFWCHETKTPTGTLKPAQLEFRSVAAKCGLEVVVGGVAAAEEFLIGCSIAERASSGSLEPMREAAR